VRFLLVLFFYFFFIFFYFTTTVDRKIQGTPSSASKDTPREKFWELVGGVVKSRI